MPKTARKSANLLPGGVKGNKGGTGRPPDWLKEKCRDLVDRKKIIERLATIASGDPVELLLDSFGKPLKDSSGKFIYGAAPIMAQVKAAQELLDRGFGKAAQSLDVVTSKSKDDIAAEEKRFERLYGYLGALKK